MTVSDENAAQQVVDTVVKSPELVEQILSDENVQVMIAQRFHSGPLPSPSDLAQYNAIISNGADRIMTMAEKEQEARHANRLQIQAFNMRGQIYGFISVIMILLFAGFLVWRGHPTAAVSLVCGTVVALATVFVIGRRQG
ncbi:DUF2335 domain-containing protein [Neisseria oralis]|uniref:DUF2335 domain-containing protein n=1 Tax=Neisseria oralis TaxID=1107316 RepID=A0ABW8Q5K3_9NEIS